ncbi:hypothetical protein DZF89_24645 [Vibrio parahaemolyticus]|nr:hypothetical protein [Vibrio parahaemolyticus]
MVWKRLLTKRLRQIRNAWHSQVILSFVFKVQWIRLGAGVAHYLTRRYAPKIGFTSILLWRIRIISIF